MERGGSNLSDKGLNSVDRGSKATLPLTIPRRRFKSPAKDSTRRRGRADIEGSKATPLMNAWLPQASYPCDVPPSQTPHLTMSSARSTRQASLDLKEGVVTPPPVHGDRLTHVQVPLTWNLSSSPSKFSFEYLLLPPRSAPTPLRRLALLGFAATAAPPTHRGLALAPTAADFDFHDHRPAVLIDQHPLWVLVSPWPPPEFLWLRPARHSSPSFGPDRHAHTRTLLEDQGRSVVHPLLGPCFKTGRMGSPQADALSTPMPRHAVRRVLQTTIKAATPPLA
ncbi:hypothetical protein Bca4012_103564 [Brassica carinata]